MKISYLRTLSCFNLIKKILAMKNGMMRQRVHNCALRNHKFRVLRSIFLEGEEDILGLKKDLGDLSNLPFNKLKLVRMKTSQKSRVINSVMRK